MNHLKRGKAKWYERCINCFSVFCWGLCVFLNPNIPVSIWCCVTERLIVRSRGVESALINACTWWCWKGTRLQNQVEKFTVEKSLPKDPILCGLLLWTLGSLSVKRRQAGEGAVGSSRACKRGTTCWSMARGKGDFSEIIVQGLEMKIVFTCCLNCGQVVIFV